MLNGCGRVSERVSVPDSPLDLGQLLGLKNGRTTARIREELPRLCQENPAGVSSTRGNGAEMQNEAGWRPDVLGHPGCDCDPTKGQRSASQPGELNVPPRRVCVNGRAKVLTISKPHGCLSTCAAERQQLLTPVLHS